MLIPSQIMIGCVVLSIGAALQASSYSIGQMIAGRIVAGLGNGYVIADGAVDSALIVVAG
jgi:MFS family permease